MMEVETLFIIKKTSNVRKCKKLARNYRLETFALPFERRCFDRTIEKLGLLQIPYGFLV